MEGRRRPGVGGGLLGSVLPWPGYVGLCGV